MSTAAPRICRKCGEEVVSGDRYCATCGTRVERGCGTCGTMLVSGDRFCPECGAPQEATGPLPVDTGYTSVWDTVVRVLRSTLSGEYRITRELGRGGQAAVFQADEIALNRMVAIKVLAPGTVNGDREVEMFRREAQTVANLTHPHIVTVYAVRQVDDLHLFVMQFIEGRSLAAIIAERGPLPLTAVRAVAYQVGNALQYAHKRNVIHRDVKPANVLFDEDGNAIVTDFGIAKDITRVSSSLTGGLIGTPAYMSPEQCHQQPVTWASDQYALGVMLYEMLTGKVPFEGSPFMVMQGHTDREPPQIRALRPDCPVELEWAVLRMLEKHPEGRWSSFGEALDALGAAPLMHDDPIRAELRRLAMGTASSAAISRPGKVRLNMRMPERLEVGERATCEVLGVSPGESIPQRVACTLTVSDPAIATIDAPTGAVLGVAPGSVRICAETLFGIVEGTLEVVAASPRELTIALPRVTLEVGETMRATAEVRDRRGEPIALSARWQSSDSSVLSVARDGMLTAIAPGSVKLSATVDALTETRTLSVGEAATASIAITPPPTQVEPGESFALSAQIFDARGGLMAGRDLQWSSSDERIATVDRFGVVSTNAAGSVRFTARHGAATASVALVVRESRLTTSPVIPLDVPAAAEPLAPPFSPAADYASAERPGAEYSSGDYRAEQDGFPEPASVSGASGVVSSASGAPSSRRWWAWAAGAAVLVVAALGYKVMAGNDDSSSKTDPSQVRAALSPKVASFIDAASLELTAPVVIDAFGDQSGGQIRVVDTLTRRGTWPTHTGRGFVVRAVLGVPDATTRAAGVAIVRKDGTTFYVEITNTTPANVRLLRLEKGRQELVAQQVAMRGSWVGPAALEVVWTDSTLSAFVDEQSVLGPINVGGMQPTRILLYVNGALSFDSVVSGSLRGR